MKRNKNVTVFFEKEIKIRKALNTKFDQINKKKNFFFLSDFFFFFFATYLYPKKLKSPIIIFFFLVSRLFQ